MWLLDAHTRRLEYRITAAGNEFAILSHTWGEEEVSFQDIQDQSYAKSLKGWAKIDGCCRQALEDGLLYCWIDCCCIDRFSSAELSEAINSMYSWYGLAKVCYAHLSDLTLDLVRVETPFEALAECRWFSRGWTLQELIAPDVVRFYDCEWNLIGDKRDMVQELAEISGVDAVILGTTGEIKSKELSSISAAARMSWASKRQTTRLEDTAYCLLGLFDVNMPLLYGEGMKAFARLQREIITKSSDHSLLVWSALTASPGEQSPIAPSPLNFEHCSQVIPFYSHALPHAEAEFTSLGLRMTLPLLTVNRWGLCAILNCRYDDDFTGPIALAVVSLRGAEAYREHEAIRVVSNLHSPYSGNGAKPRFPVLPMSAIAQATRRSILFIEYNPTFSYELAGRTYNPHRTNLVLAMSSSFTSNFNVLVSDPKNKFNANTRVLSWRNQTFDVVQGNAQRGGQGSITFVRKRGDSLLRLKLLTRYNLSGDGQIAATFHEWVDPNWSRGQAIEPPQDARQSPNMDFADVFELMKGVVTYRAEPTVLLDEICFEIHLDYLR